MTVTSSDRLLLDTLSECASFCRRCQTLNLEYARAVGDFRRVAHLAAHDDRGHDWAVHLERAQTDRDFKRSIVEAHLAEPHQAPVRAEEPAAAPEPKPDDRTPCPSCGQRVNIRLDGRLAVHYSRNGIKCTRRFLAVEVDVSALPTPDVPTADVQLPAPALRVTGRCHTCDKQVTGERRYCGQCLRKRGRL